MSFQALQAGHATLLANEKTMQEKAMKDAIAKTDAAWRDQEDSLRKAIQALRSGLDAARSERDKIRSSSVAKESVLQKVRFLLRPPRSSSMLLDFCKCV